MIPAGQIGGGMIRQKGIFRLLDGFLQTNAPRAASAALAPLWERFPPLISGRFNVVVLVVESSDVLDFKQLKLFRTKQQ